MRGCSVTVSIAFREDEAKPRGLSAASALSPKNYGIHLGFCLIEVFALIAQYQRGEGAQGPWVKQAGPLMPHTAQSSPTLWAQLQAAPLGFFSALVCQRARFKNGAKGTVDTTAWGLAQQCLYTLGCGCRQSGRKRKCKTT